MIGAPLAVLLAATPAPQLPERSVCLLAGPSATLIAVELARREPGYVVSALPGQVWPFASASIRLAQLPGAAFFEGKDEAAGLVVALSTGFAAEGGVNLQVYRGASRLEGLPLLGGSCATSGSEAAGAYPQLAAAASAGGRVTAETFRTGRLSASRQCQVVSASGWVARFSVDYHDDGQAITIRPADRNLWRDDTVRSTRLGLPSPSVASWIRFAFGLIDDSTPDMRGSINSIWVYSTPDGGQSSARASFFGHDPEGPVAKEDVSGLCTEFAAEGTGG